MTETPIERFQLHTICRSDFDFSEDPNVIYSVGEDLLKKFDINTKSIVSTHDLLEPSYSIAVYPNDKTKTVLGGVESCRAEIFTDLNMESPFPIMSFSGPIYRLVMSNDGSYVGGSSHDGSYAVYNNQQNKMYRPKPAHDSTVLHIGFNYTVKYVTSTGCEGIVNIYSIAKMEANPLICLVKSQRISKETRLDSPQLLKFDWHPKENLIALPGDISLQILRENGEDNFSYTLDSAIRHNKEISAVCWNSDGSKLLTFCTENVFKLWNFDTKELIQFFNYTQSIYCCKYSPEGKLFGFMGHDGHFGVWRESTITEIETINNKKQQPATEATEKELGNESEDEEATIDKLIREKEEEYERERSRESSNKEILESKSFLDEERLGEVLNKKEPAREHHRHEHKKQGPRHADIIDTSAQPIFYPSSTTLSKGRRFLSWNLTGSIIKTEETGFSTIDVDFTDRTFHLNIRIQDNYGISMGTMNPKGIVMASKADEIREDEYEDELKDETRRFSHLIFRPLNNQIDKETEWVLPLPEGENIDAVAIGNNWIAAITDIHFIRFFNLGGLEINTFSLEKPIVCCAGYENLLAIVYHDNPPFLGCQCLKLKVIDVETCCTIFEGSCPISPNTTLTWFGFSDNGMLVSQDSRGIVRAFVGYKQWWPIYSADETKRNTQLWLIGIHDYNLIGVIPERDDFEPSVNPRPAIKTFLVKFPMTREDQETEKYSEVLKKQMILDHEKFRNKSWLNYQITREKNDSLFSVSNSVFDRTAIMNYETKVEKEIVDLFQDFVVNEEYEKAYTIASTLKISKSLSVCLFLCNQLKATSLIDKITGLLEARKKIEELNEIERNNKGNSGIVIIKQNESNSILDNRKPKKGLSSYAVNLHNLQKESLQGQNHMENLEISNGKENKAMFNEIYNQLEEFETQEIMTDKFSQSKVYKSQSSNGKSNGMGDLFGKKADSQIQNKRSSALFSTFAGPTPTNTLKRKPEQPLPRDDYKRFK